jgi:hypothetical protein
VCVRAKFFIFDTRHFIGQENSLRAKIAAPLDKKVKSNEGNCLRISLPIAESFKKVFRHGDKGAEMLNYFPHISAIIAIFAI